MGKFCIKVNKDNAEGKKYCNISVDYKKGFLVINKSERTVALRAYDTVEEYEVMMGVEPGSYAKMNSIGLGKQVELAEGLCTRIW